MDAAQLHEVLPELAERWRRARRAALREVVPGATGAEDDDQLLAQALARDDAGTLRKVFDKSQKLGDSFSRFFRIELTLDDLPEALARLSTPCAVGAWTAVPGEPALRLERPGCPVAALGGLACDFWREAVNGLVLGLGGEVRHARHASQGRGGASCIDVLYVNPQSPHRFGPIPAPMLEPLAGAARLAKRFDSRVEVEFLGLSEGVLYYQERRRGCGSELSASTQLERALHRQFPDLVLRELSPRAVLDGEDHDHP